MKKGTQKTSKRRDLGCLFCGMTGKLSGEHLWPAWMEEYFAKDSSRRERSESRNTNGAIQPRHDRTMQGGPWKTKVKAVCKKCNNGWVSDIEDDLKETLLSLGRDERIILDIVKQKQIAVWTLLKAMVVESRVPGLSDTRSFTSEECRKIWQNRDCIPSNFYSWIVRSSAHVGWSGNYLRTNAALPLGVDMSHDPLDYNSSAGMWGIGELLIVWYYSRRPDIVLNYQPDDLVGCQIWPPKFKVINWPPSAHFSGHEKLAASIKSGLWATYDEADRMALEGLDLKREPDWLKEYAIPSNLQNFSGE